MANKDMSNAPAGAIADAPDGTPRLEGDDLVARLEAFALLIEKWPPSAWSGQLNDVRSAAARIRELEAEREWKPISSAPKDGSTIVVGFAHQSGFPVKVVWWSRLHKVWKHYGEWQPGLENNATHWMPLPPKPINEVAEGSRAAALPPTQPTKEKDNG